MDIKIGLADSPRELVIRVAEDGAAVLSQLAKAIEAGNPVVQLADEKGRQFLIRTEKILYVEQGSATAHSVGFMR